MCLKYIVMGTPWCIGPCSRLVIRGLVVRAHPVSGVDRIFPGGGGRPGEPCFFVRAQVVFIVYLVHIKHDFCEGTWGSRGIRGCTCPPATPHIPTSKLLLFSTLYNRFGGSSKHPSTSAPAPSAAFMKLVSH